MNPASIKKYRLTPWRCALVYMGASYRFIYEHVLAPIVSQKPVTEFGVDAVTPKLTRLRLLWANRVRAFVERKLWLFGTPETNESLHYTGRRRLFCTPELIKLRNKKYRGRPCSERAICPFCFARRSRWLYRKVRTAIAAAGDLNTLYLYCRVSRRFVSANDFSVGSVWSEASREFATRKLRERIRASCTQYDAEIKTVSAATIGTVWQVVVEPVSNGWTVETRQLTITRGRPRGLFLKRSRSHTTAFVRCRARDQDAIAKVLQPFCAYPRGLLYDFEELAAAVMHARRKLRLYRTTGCLVGKRPRTTSEEVRSCNCASVDVPV